MADFIDFFTKKRKHFLVTKMFDLFISQKNLIFPIALVYAMLYLCLFYWPI